MRYLLAITFATGAIAQENPMDLLHRVQASAAASADRIARYMCTETVDRSQYKPDGHDLLSSACDTAEKPDTHLVVTDRLRLEVTMGGALEMYSWIGEKRFNDRDLGEMVRDGAISTGSFASLLGAIFQDATASFTYNGDSTFEGRTVSEFGFTVPLERSGYTFGKDLHAVNTGFGGTFLVDPATAELLHIEQATNRLPSQTQACEASTTLDYARAQVKGIDLLLPRLAVLRITHPDGGYSENRMVFTNCHEFNATSKLSFDAPADSRVVQPVEKTPLTIPIGQRFQVVFLDGIDTSSAAGGDPLKARLATPIHLAGNIVLESGTNISARIVRVRQYANPAPWVEFEIKLERIDYKGAWIDLVARPDWKSIAFEVKKSKTQLTRRVDLGILSALAERSMPFVFRNVKLPFQVAGGLESHWITSK